MREPTMYARLRRNTPLHHGFQELRLEAGALVEVQHISGRGLVRIRSANRGLRRFQTYVPLSRLDENA